MEVNMRIYMANMLWNRKDFAKRWNTRYI